MPDERKKKKKKLPRVLSDREIDLLFNAIPTRSFTAIRNRAAFDLMLYGGMRVSEVCDLKNDSFYWADPSKELDGSDASTVTIFGKGSKERKIGVPKNIRADLNAWIAKKPKDSVFFLCTHDGNRLTRNYLYASLKRYVAKALCSVEESQKSNYANLKYLHPHTFRHTMATKMHRAGIPISVIMKFLGHSSVSTTMIYEHTDSSDVIAAQSTLNQIEETRKKARE